MLQIKVSSNDIAEQADLSQFTGNSNGVFGQCQFYFNTPLESADAWIVIDEPPPWDQACHIPDGSLILVSAETAREPGYFFERQGMLDYVQQFDRIFTFFDAPRHKATYDWPYLPWMVNSNHGSSIYQPHHRDINSLRDMKFVPKSRELSVICSGRTQTSGHRMRLRFLESLHSQTSVAFDWFGNGVQPLLEKWDGLAPYKYTIVLENQANPHIVTEKLIDAFLALTYPIYWGAQDAAQIFPINSFASINISDFEGSVQLVEQILAEDPYQEFLPNLWEAKQIALNEFHFLRRLERIVTARLVPTSGTRNVSERSVRLPQDCIRGRRDRVFRLMGARRSGPPSR